MKASFEPSEAGETCQVETIVRWYSQGKSNRTVCQVFKIQRGTLIGRANILEQGSEPKAELRHEASILSGSALKIREKYPVVQ